MKQSLSEVKPSILISLGLILFGFLLGALIFSGKLTSTSPPPSQSPPPQALQKYEIDGVTLNTQGIDEPSARRLVSLAKETLKEEFLPETLNVSLEKNPADQRPVFLASWLKDVKIFFLLYVPGPTPTEPSYFRVWYLPPGEQVDEASAQKLVADVFREDYVTLSQSITCGPAKDPEKGNDVTECNSITTLDSGVKKAVTARAPFLLTPDKKSIIVHACYIPKEATSSYPANSCI